MKPVTASGLAEAKVSSFLERLQSDGEEEGGEEEEEAHQEHVRLVAARGLKTINFW